MSMKKNEKSLRVVMNDLNVGGTETHLSRVLPLLADQYGWRITVILLSKKLVLLEKLSQSPSVSVIYPEVPAFTTKVFSEQGFIYRCVETWAAFRLLCLNFLRDRRTITHYFLPKAYLLGGLAALATGLPAKQCMGRRSLNCYQKKYPWVKWLEKKWHQRMACITANSDKIVQQLVQEEDVHPNKVTKIYNGVGEPDPEYLQQREQYRQRLTTMHGLPQDAWILVVVANLIPYKGHLDLLLALSGISTAETGGRPWHLLCAGFDNGYGKTLRDAAQKLGIADQVHWLGRQSDVLAFYAGADMGILNSYGNEGFSNAILEGMSLGLPMVVTDVGGNAEAVVHEQTGLVVSPKDVPALRTAVVRLLQNPELMSIYGQAGRQRIKTEFSLSECVSHYDRFYQEILES